MAVAQSEEIQIGYRVAFRHVLAGWLTTGGLAKALPAEVALVDHLEYRGSVTDPNWRKV